MGFLTHHQYHRTPCFNLRQVSPKSAEPCRWIFLWVFFSEGFPATVGKPLVKTYSILLFFFWDYVLLLMEEILHHLGSKHLVNIGVNYLSTGAGFLPSTVWTEKASFVFQISIPSKHQRAQLMEFFFRVIFARPTKRSWCKRWGRPAKKTRRGDFFHHKIHESDGGWQALGMKPKKLLLAKKQMTEEWGSWWFQWFWKNLAKKS